MREVYLLLLQFGHGHWSHPQPVQAERIMRQIISTRADLQARGESVLEVSRTPRGERWLRGKDDALDATEAFHDA